MNILALDLGSSTGWALHVDGTCLSRTVFQGTWELETKVSKAAAKKLRMDRRLDPRVMAFVNNLEALRRQTTIDYIFFEDVKFASYQAAAHLWGSFRGALWAFAHLNGIQVDCLDTGKLKKFATGSGSSDKSRMARALVNQNPSRYRMEEKGLVADKETGTLLGDDAVDAIHLLNWAKFVLNVK